MIPHRRPMSLCPKDIIYDTASLRDPHKWKYALYLEFYSEQRAPSTHVVNIYTGVSGKTKSIIKSFSQYQVIRRFPYSDTFFWFFQHS